MGPAGVDHPLGEFIKGKFWGNAFEKRNWEIRGGEKKASIKGERETGLWKKLNIVDENIETMQVVQRLMVFSFRKTSLDR